MKRILGDRYELGQMIGTGGMADVYLAEDKRLHREVAVKILRSDLARDPAFVNRFNKEALAAAGLNHPESSLCMTLVKKRHPVALCLHSHGICRGPHFARDSS